MIQTDEYSLTERQYFKILIITRLREHWWAYVLMILVALLFLPRFFKDPVAGFVVVFMATYIPLMILYLYNFAYSKDNKAIYRKHQLTFTSDKITAYSLQDTVFDTPTINEIAVNQIIKTETVTDFWLLYVAKGQFLPVPKNIFKSEEDQEVFRKMFNIK